MFYVDTLICSNNAYTCSKLSTYQVIHWLYFLPSEALITPEQFAEQLCDDLDLPASQFMASVASQIRQQCDQFTSDLIPDDGDDRRVVIKVSSPRLHVVVFV